MIVCLLIFGLVSPDYPLQFFVGRVSWVLMFGLLTMFDQELLVQEGTGHTYLFALDTSDLERRVHISRKP